MLSLLTSILHWARIATKDSWTLSNIRVRISNLIFSLSFTKPQPVSSTRSGFLTAMLLRLKSPGIYFNILIPCTANLLFHCTMTNKCTIISQMITLLNVSTLSCHTQGECSQYLAKLHKYSNSAVGNITHSCIWNNCVNWQGIDCKPPEDDSIVLKHVGVW